MLSNRRLDPLCPRWPPLASTSEENPRGRWELELVGRPPPTDNDDDDDDDYDKDDDDDDDDNDDGDDNDDDNDDAT
jgi:hypothetical protein